MKCKCGKKVSAIEIYSEILEEDGETIKVKILDAQAPCKCGLRTHLTKSEIEKIVLHDYYVKKSL